MIFAVILIVATAGTGLASKAVILDSAGIKLPDFYKWR